MTDIEWGPAIAVDGKRPGWLCGGEWRRVRTLAVDEWQTADIESPGDTIPDMDEWNWSDIIAIRLPADHPHYRQPAPIDWSGELEAVHEDGRVVPVKLRKDEGGDNSALNIHPPLEDYGGACWFNRDGSHLNFPSWRIRNVTPQPNPQADTKPDVTARMEAFVQRVATEADYPCQMVELRDEARAIVALLPEPEPVADPDVAEAEAIAKDLGWGPELVPGSTCEAILMGIKRGRGLALAGETGK